MSYRRLLVYRLAFAVVGIYLVMTLAFLFVALTPDPNLGLVSWGAATSEGQEAAKQAVDAYREAHNLDDPVLQRYARWLVDISTLDWGRSFVAEEPVMDVLARAVPATLGYVVPGVVLATVPGVLFGVATAVGDGGVVERAGTAAAYVGLGLPNFWLAVVLPVVVVEYAGWLRFLLAPHVVAFAGVRFTMYTMPAVVLATSLFAGWVRYARAESLEYVNADFVKTLRAKGASDAALGRHVLRNAALPLVTLFVTDLISVLVLHVYVLEYVFHIEGLGFMGYRAVRKRDMPLILGTTMVIAFAGVLATAFQDVVEPLLDPRVEQ
ncbi:ABC transporter permease [Halomicrococcus sp. SG-WS-1]|uniref:ABC transporter permease n=1 Tax=Halomicrococcus sp. SG-WS-1 TaxID=3439057 RepID=UPI003F79EB63